MRLQDALFRLIPVLLVRPCAHGYTGRPAIEERPEGDLVQ